MLTRAVMGRIAQVRIVSVWCACSTSVLTLHILRYVSLQTVTPCEPW